MIKHYWKVYLRYMKLNIKSIMLYDLDYILGIVAMFIKCLVNFSMILLIYYIMDNIDGWTIYEMMFIYGLSTISFSLWHCFFIDVITIPVYIQTGEFDNFLLKPVNPLFQIMMNSFDEDGWGELIFGIIILIISIMKLNIRGFLLLLIPVFCMAGCFIVAGLSILCSSVSFFTIGNLDLTNNIMDFKEFAKYPLTIFNNLIRIVFTVFIPIAFVGYYPSLLYLSKMRDIEMYLAWMGVPISLIFFWISYKIWNWSLRYYTSSGN